MVRLTEAESTLLGVLRLNADATMLELSRRCKMRPHRVRYAIEGLQRKGLIRRRVIIDPARLGLSIYGVWFSLSATGRRQRERIIDWWRSSDSVSYLGEFLGDFEFKVDLLVRGPHEAEAVMAQCASRFGGIFSKSAIALTLQSTEFPFRALASGVHEQRCIGRPGETFSIDACDRAILKTLAGSESMAETKIAHRLGMPVATFAYRVKKLVQRKIIAAYQYWSPVEALADAGLASMVHRVFLRTPATTHTRHFDSLFNDELSVYSVTQCFGTWQMEICTTSQTPSLVKGLLGKLETLLGDDLLDCISVPILAHHKVSGFPAG